MAFPRAFENVKNRVYLVGLFNDVDPTKRGKFFGLGEIPSKVTVVDGGKAQTVSFRNFLNLLQPQLAAVQSGVVDETNWFFQVGDPKEQSSHGSADLLVGFPGRNIFQSVQDELNNLRDLLHRLVDTYFNEFSKSLDSLGGWSNGSWLPEGLLALFVEGIADDWLFSHERPTAITERLKGGIDGFVAWANEFGPGVEPGQLLGRLESWSHARLERERGLVEKAGTHPSAPEALKQQTGFLRDVGAIQKLARICGSKTLLKLLVFWPYEFILNEARQAWKSVSKRKDLDALKNYRGYGPYEAWDFLLATSWVNHCTLEEVAGSGFRGPGERAALKASLDSAPSPPQPVLAKPQERDTYEIRRRQIDDHVQGWTILFGHDDLDQLDSAMTASLQTLLDCGEDRKEKWPAVIETAKRYQRLWGTDRKLAKKAAPTFARAAVGPSLDALFQTPTFGPSDLPEIYEAEFIQLYSECLAAGEIEDFNAVRKIGDDRKDRYQPIEGVSWSEPSEAVRRGGLRFDTVTEAAVNVIDRSEKRKVHVKIAQAAPAARYFAYGVNRRVAANSDSATLVYLLRYDTHLSGTAGETARRITAFREVMREGIRGEVASVVQKVIDDYNRKCSPDDLPVQTVDVRVSGPDTAREKHRTNVPVVGLPYYPVETNAFLAGVNRDEVKAYVTKDTPKRAGAERDRRVQTKKQREAAEAEHKAAQSRVSEREQEHRAAKARLEELRAEESKPPDDAEAGKHRAAQEEASASAARHLEEERTKLAATGSALEKAKKAEVPRPVVFDVDFTIEGDDETAIADWGTQVFQDAWNTILTTARGSFADKKDFQDRLRRLLLNEFFLITRQRLNADQDQWLDLKLLLDLVGSGTIEEFLAKHSLTLYSDRLDGAHGLSGRFNELSRLVSSSLDTMRLIVSELHGVRFLLESGSWTNQQLVFYNGTAEEFLTTTRTENLLESVPVEDGDRTPHRFLELSLGKGRPADSFFAPGCVYFTSLAFPEGARVQKRTLREELETLPLCGHDGRDYAMALPPMLMDLGTLSGPVAGWWRQDDWPAGRPENPLTTVPLHYVGPSPWLRGPAAKAAADSAVNRFTTVLPAGYLVLRKLLQQHVGFEAKAPGIGPEDAFLFNIAKFSTPYRENLDDVYNIRNQKASLTFTMNLYFALIDAITQHWDGVRGAQRVDALAAGVPPGDNLSRTLWEHLAFDNNRRTPTMALNTREDESRVYLTDPEQKWRELWWFPMIIPHPSHGQTALAPMHLFDMNTAVPRADFEIGSELTGWLLEILKRY